MYKAAWDDLIEQQAAPGNYRRSVTGLTIGLNKIRWEHPSGIHLHKHDTAEQAIVCIEGRMEWTVADETLVVEAGEVLMIPQGVMHGGHTIDGDATFYEVLSPTLIQTLPGFLGSPLH